MARTTSWTCGESDVTALRRPAVGTPRLPGLFGPAETWNHPLRNQSGFGPPGTSGPGAPSGGAPWLVTAAVSLGPLLAYDASRTNTESAAPLGVKVRDPVAAKLPMVVLLPVAGSNQRAVTVPASLAMLMVSVRLLGT